MAQQTKKSVRIIVLGVLLIAVAGPVFRGYLTSITMFSQAGIPITEESTSGIGKAFAYPVSIAGGQKMTIKFSASEVNCSSTLKILPKATYDANVAANSSGGSYAGNPFIYTRASHGDTYVYNDASMETSATINQAGYWLIEFSGTAILGNYYGSDYYLVSIPGTYVIVVYGTNTTDASTNEGIRFNLSVESEFPGRTIAFYAELAGWAIIGIFGTIVVVNLFKKVLGGRDEP